jgi:hypothetical protein
MLDDVANDPARKGAIAFLVSAEPDVTERINITAPVVKSGKWIAELNNSASRAPLLLCS